MSKPTVSVAIIILVIAGSGVAAFLFWPKLSPQSQVSPTSTTPVACTEEAKICTDGSSVGRTGPRCEFASCPEEKSEVKFTATYIHAQSWPPVIKVTTEPFVCEEGGSEIVGGNGLLGKAVKRSINGRVYCVHTASEGAAGTTYTTYVYATPVANKLITGTFTLGFVQCLNYDKPAQTDCLQEQKSFNPDDLVSEVVANMDK